MQEALQNARAIAQSLLLQNAEALREKQELLATLVSVTPAHDLSFEDALQNPLITEGTDLVVLGDSGHVMSFYSADSGLQDTELRAVTSGSFGATKVDKWWLGNNQLYQIVFESVDLPENSGQWSRMIAVGRVFGYKQLHNLSDILRADLGVVHRGHFVETTLRPLEEIALQEIIGKSCCATNLQIGEKRFNTISLDLGQKNDDVQLLILKSADLASPERDRLHELFWTDTISTILSFVLGVFLWFV